MVTSWYEEMPRHGDQIEYVPERRIRCTLKLGLTLAAYIGSSMEFAVAFRAGSWGTLGSMQS